MAEMLLTQQMVLLFLQTSDIFAISTHMLLATVSPSSGLGHFQEKLYTPMIFLNIRSKMT